MPPDPNDEYTIHHLGPDGVLALSDAQEAGLALRLLASRVAAAYAPTTIYAAYQAAKTRNGAGATLESRRESYRLLFNALADWVAGTYVRLPGGSSTP